MFTSTFAHISNVLFLKMFPGWGRFIEKIRPRIHNHSSWSPKGKANNCYPKFRQVCQFSLTSFICISFGLENVCVSVACLQNLTMQWKIDSSEYLTLDH